MVPLPSQRVINIGLARLCSIRKATPISRRCRWKANTAQATTPVETEREAFQRRLAAGVLTAQAGGHGARQWLAQGVVQQQEVQRQLSMIQWSIIVQRPEQQFAIDHREQLSEPLRARVEKSMMMSGTDYLIAKDRMFHVMNAFDEYFATYDAILCPSALGTAPQGLTFTGNPIMQTVWSFAGLPSVNLPLLTLSNGLPLGVQAVGSYQNDARLLRSSRWLVSEFVKRNMA